MIKDLEVLYRKANQETNGRITLDNYVLKEGIYLKIDPDKSLAENQEQQNDRLLVVRKKQLSAPSKRDLHEWFLSRDFYSNAISANKFVDTGSKKIHNTHYLALFMKMDTFIADDPQKAKEERQKKFLLEDEWRAYVEQFYTEKLKAKDEKMRLIPGYVELKRYMDSDARAAHQVQICNFLISNSSGLIEWIKRLKTESAAKNYVKLFFEADEADYKRENQIYTIPSIFLKNDYNVETESGLYGVPSYNIGLNDKKPFLKSHTKKSMVPLLVPPEEAALRKELFSWLQAQKPMTVQRLVEKELFEIQEPHKAGEMIHIRLDGSGVINYFEKTPFSRGNQLDEPFFMKNIIHTYEWIDKKNYVLAANREPVLKPGELLALTSQYFFKNYLHSDMLSSEPKINSGVFPGEMQNLFYSSRQALYDFFFKGTDLTLKPMINRLSQQLIEIQLLKTVKGTAIGNLGQAFNLRLGWLMYFELKGSDEKVRKLTELVAHFRAKFANGKAENITDDPEFYFAAGQLSYFLLSQSEAAKKTFGMFEGVLRAKRPALLKRQLDDLFMTYGHAVLINPVVFKSAMAAVMAYQPAEPMIQGENRDYLLAGILSHNVFYDSNKKQNDANKGSDDQQ